MLLTLHYRNIGVIYESLRDHNTRPAMFGAPNEGEIFENVNKMGGQKPRPTYIMLFNNRSKIIHYFLHRTLAFLSLYSHLVLIYLYNNHRLHNVAIYP